MVKKKLYLRADGDVVAGYGHVVRLIALADMLKKIYSCIFIIKTPDSFIKAQLEKSCDGIIELPASAQYATEWERYLSKRISSSSIVVLDGYHFDETYQQKIKDHCFKVVSIDDIQSFPYAADAVINHSEGVESENFSLAPFTALYTGVKYAILRKPFVGNALKYAEYLKKKTSVRAFVNLGGTDQQNYTLKALKECLKQEEVKRVDVVVGSYYAHLDALKAFCLKHPRVSISIHAGLSALQMKQLMKKSDIGLCSASTVSYEYASVAKYLFVYQTVENQKNIYQFLIKHSIAFKVGKLSKVLAERNSKSFVKKYAAIKQQFFGGTSQEAILKIFQAFEVERLVSIRKAKVGDAMQYFKWVNEKEVRKNSVNTAPVVYSDHVKWFNRKVKSKEAALYFFSYKEKPLGQVRIDLHGEEAEIDYSIDKKYRGKGFGSLLIRKAVVQFWEKHPLVSIKAKVKSKNLASSKVFEKLGFEKLAVSMEKKVWYAHYQISPK